MDNNRKDQFLNILKNIEAEKTGKKLEDITFQDIVYLIEEILQGKSYGTILKDNSVIKDISSKFPVLTGTMLENVRVPTQFDGRDYWFDYLPSPAQMYDCGRGWLFAAVECLSARYNIFTPNQRNVLLTSIDPIFCNYPDIKEDIPISEEDSSIVQKTCKVCTGSVYYALKYLYVYGSPMTSCAIYEDMFEQLQGKPACDFNQDEIYNECDTLFPNERSTCLASKKAIHRFRCSSFANVENNEETIKKEIFKNGPVVASYLLYDDFLNEYTGRTIYTGPKKDAKLLGGHSGKIVGWGEEKGVKYWIVSNSWSLEWGEGGYFKIQRGSNTCSIEDNVVTLYPDFAVDYPLFPKEVTITDQNLNKLREDFNVNNLNYYEDRIVELIKQGKIEGDLDNFFNLQMMPNISTTNAGEVYAVPIIYQEKMESDTDGKLKIWIIILIILGGLILGTGFSYLLHRITRKKD
jgi:hypothetical protein